MIRQASSRHCFVCGRENPFGLHMVFTMDRPGHVFSDFSVDKQFQGYPGIVHGGILASLLDEAMGRATLETAVPTRYLVTGSLSVRYRRPVPVETPLHLEAEVLQDLHKIVKSHSAIYLKDGTLLVEGDALLCKPGEALYDQIKLNDDEWQVV